MRYSVLCCLFVTAAMAATDKKPSLPKLIVLSMGGLGSDIFGTLPKSVARRSAMAGPDKLLPVMPTKGPVNHFSIVTGVHADVHGVIDDCEYDEPKGQCVYGQPDLTKISPIWMDNQSRGGVSVLINWPRHEDQKPTSYIEMKFESVDETYCIRQNFDDITNIVDKINSGKFNLVMVYYNFLDKFYKNNPFLTSSEIHCVDHFIDLFVNKMKLYKDINLIVLGTHWVQRAYENGAIRLNEILTGKYDCRFDALGANAIVTPNSEDQSGMVYEILEKNDGTTEGKKKYRVYYQRNIPENWHIKESPLLQDKIFLVANSGYFFWNQRVEGIKNSRPSGEFVANFDGYSEDTNSDQSLNVKPTVFMAVGPRFKSATEVPNFSTIDVYPLLRELLKLPEKENQNMSGAVSALLKPEAVEKDKKTVNSDNDHASENRCMGQVLTYLRKVKHSFSKKPQI